MSPENLLQRGKSLWAWYQEIPQRTKGNLLILAGLLLFVGSSMTCSSRIGEQRRENQRRFMSGEPNLPIEGPWHYWPDSCGIWFWLVLAGGLTRLGFLGGKLTQEEMKKLQEDSRKSALLRHLLPVISKFDIDGKDMAMLQEQYFKQHSLPFPDYLLGEDHVTLKVLPAGDTKPKLAAQLFEQLHALQGKIRFEIVFEHGTIYFRVKCSRALKDAVSQQIAIHFPDATIEIHHADDVDQLVAVRRYRYRYGPAAGKTLEDFPIDPYAQLFALMDRLGDGQIVSFCVECQPFPAETIMAVSNTLLRHDSEVSYNRGDGWKKFLQQVQAKLPVWAVVCLVAVETAFGDERDAERHFAELDRFLEGLDAFCNQYRNGEQEWEKYTNDECVGGATGQRSTVIKSTTSQSASTFSIGNQVFWLHCPQPKSATAGAIGVKFIYALHCQPTTCLWRVVIHQKLPVYRCYYCYDQAK